MSFLGRYEERETNQIGSGSGPKQVEKENYTLMINDDKAHSA